MLTALLLLSDCSFSHAVVDRGIDWAIESNGSIVAVFSSSADVDAKAKHSILGQNRPESDAGGRQTTIEDSEILYSYIGIFKMKAAMAGVHVQDALVGKQVRHYLSQYLEDCEKVFIAQEDKEFFLLSHTLIDLVYKSAVPIEWIK